MKENNIQGEILNLKYIHTYLTWLSYFNKNSSNVEESIIEDFDFKGLLKRKWGTNILSENSFERLEEFRKKWLVYKESVNYAGDTVFMFFDQKWKHIVEEYLCPALDSLELDFSHNNIEYISYIKNADFDACPSSSEILERGETLYKLLLNNKIIKKRYMD